MPKIQCKCINCNIDFLVFPARIRQGGGKFCCQSCVAKYYGKIISDKQCNKFLENVEIKENGCWEYRYINDKGYGQIRINGKRISAHRYNYEVVSGEKIPANLQVCHHCDNRRCVRFEHLFLGAQKDNMQDMKIKNRANRPIGSKHPLTKLNEQQVMQIKLKLKENIPDRVIIQEYNISNACFQGIKHNRTWKHVSLI